MDAQLLQWYVHTWICSYDGRYVYIDQLLNSSHLFLQNSGEGIIGGHGQHMDLSSGILNILAFITWFLTRAAKCNMLIVWDITDLF